MNPNPNLITESGREHLSLAVRAGLLEADVLDLQARRPPVDHKKAFENWQLYGHPVHQFNQLIGNIRACVRDCRRENAMDKSWGRLNLSKIECLVLAWRRGGVAEHDRVYALAYPRISRRA
jgi:hypothetical protein